MASRRWSNSAPALTGGSVPPEPCLHCKTCPASARSYTPRHRIVIAPSLLARDCR
ncbi:hypothetical protein KCP75_00140 [Salmonella enterica subsp. enterica]|nr:hypothetical protein KCP75_00140 [Salmonella enterica subsp. enterica]